MALSGFLKQSNAVSVIIGPFVDDSDGNTVETALTISPADIRLSKNAGDMAQKNESTSCTHDELGYYTCLLDATDTGTAGILTLMVHAAGALPIRHDYLVLPANIFDSWFGTDKQEVDISQIGGVAVPNTSGRLHVLDDEGNTIANESKQDTIDTVVDAIKAKTDLLPSGIAKGTEYMVVFFMVLSSDHVTPATGKTVTVQVSKDGGAFAGSSNSVAEISNGWYKVTLTAVEMDADVIAFKATGADCDQTNLLMVTST